MAFDRILAWGCMEFHFMGCIHLSIGDSGEKSAAAGSEPQIHCGTYFFPYLYDTVYSRKLDYICHFGFQPACHVSGTHVPLLWYGAYFKSV